MTDTKPKSFSRRQWLGFAATSTLGASAGAGLMKSQAAELGAADQSGRIIYNIRDFGAKGDGQALDTKALQAAIDACHQNQGGLVLVPAGVFVIGTVELKSNVTLHIAAQGKLLGSGEGKNYFAAAIPLHGDTTLEDGNVGLLFAVNAENITIEGSGTIDGQGDQFRGTKGGPPPPAGISGPQRPYHLLFYQCKNLRVRDIFLKDSAFHSIRIIQSDYVWLTGLHIHSRRIHNSDGFHFISARHVHVDNCDVECQDDACALFGSCQFVTVTNCSFSTRWSVFRFGGGVAENITVSNCIIYETFGCPIKMRCSPGSRFENIAFSHLVMNGVTGPISIGNGPHSRQNNNPPVEETLPRPTGICRNISFQGIRATVVKPYQLPDCPVVSGYNPGEIFSCITLNAFDEALLENISFNDIHITFPGGGTAEQAAVREVPKIAGEYYAMGVPPAYAVYARNVRGLTMQNMRFETAATDRRPAVVLDHVVDAAINGCSLAGESSAESALRLQASQDVLLSAMRLLSPASTFLQVEGTTSRGIVIDGGDLSQAATALAFKNDASPNAAQRT